MLEREFTGPFFLEESEILIRFCQLGLLHQFLSLLPEPLTNTRFAKVWEETASQDFSSIGLRSTLLETLLKLLAPASTMFAFQLDTGPLLRYPGIRM